MIRLHTSKGPKDFPVLVVDTVIPSNQRAVPSLSPRPRKFLKGFTHSDKIPEESDLPEPLEFLMGNRNFIRLTQGSRIVGIPSLNWP